MQAFKLDRGLVAACTREDASIIVYSPVNEADHEEMFKSLDYRKYDLESALDPDENSRIEFEGDRTVIIVKHPKRARAVEENIRFEVSSVGIFIEPGKVTLITSESKLDFGTKPFSPDATLTDVVLRFLSVTVHHFMLHLKAIKMITSEIQSKINISMENKYLLQMFGLVESLIYYTNSIESNEAVLVKMKVLSAKMGLTEMQSDYLGDVILENQQCIKQATIYNSVLSGLMDARGNIINNNVNVLLKKLTLINVVFLPLNLLAGIGGMSEFTMMTSWIPWWISYSLFLIAVILLGFFSWVYLLPMLERPRKAPAG